jgi:hypothetical protein
MSANAISQAAGADLLNLYGKNVGQAAATTAVDASAAALKTAIAEAKMSEADLVGGNGSDSGNLLNVYG